MVVNAVASAISSIIFRHRRFQYGVAILVCCPFIMGTLADFIILKRNNENMATTSNNSIAKSKQSNNLTAPTMPSARHGIEEIADGVLR